MNGVKIEKLAKELCNKSCCHHKCKDTKDCIVEDDALLLINQDKSNNFEGKSNDELVPNRNELPFVLTNEEKVSVKEKQIEEMVVTLYEGMLPLKETYSASELASILYNAGYRKQSEGEWIGEADGYADGELVYDVWHCSECNHCIDDGTDDPDLLANFCPNCGAKMKGVVKKYTESEGNI